MVNKLGIDKQFKAAVNMISALPEEGILDVSVEKKLKFYALYKVATEGKSENAKPSILNFIERLKWKEWNKMQHISQDKAKELYVRELGETLKEIYDSGKSDYYLENSDMSFLKKISIDDINVLCEYAMEDEDTDEGLKTILLQYKKKIIG